MGITFNADEIFEMAEEIERNGAKFYREAAGNSSSKETKKMFLDMALMEDGHLKTFQLMRKELAEAEKLTTTFDPDNQAALYLQAMADSHGTEGRKKQTQKLTGDESVNEILKIALEAEINSVVFYTGLKELVSARAGKNKIEDIIKEEIAHIGTIKSKMANLT